MNGISRFIGNSSLNQDQTVSSNRLVNLIHGHRRYIGIGLLYNLVNQARFDSIDNAKFNIDAGDNTRFSQSLSQPATLAFDEQPPWTSEHIAHLSTLRVNCV